MPSGSVLVVDGNAAGPECKHAVVAASERRISLTFRRLSDAARTKISQQNQERQERLQQKVESKRAAKARTVAERTEQRRQKNLASTAR